MGMTILPNWKAVGKVVVVYLGRPCLACYLDTKSHSLPQRSKFGKAELESSEAGFS